MTNSRLKNTFKKICAVLIVLVIIGTSLIIPPKKVEAQMAVFDAIAAGLSSAGNAILGAISAVSNAVIGSGITALVTKDYKLDPLFNAMAKIALRAITSSVTSWAANGFNGSPAFIQNPSKFFTDVADQEIGKFLYNSKDYEWMCSPFRFEIKRAIVFNRSFAERSQCTLTGAVGNFKDFISSTQNSLGDLGGWNSWVQIATVPQNNPYGTYALAQVQLEAQINGSVQRSKNLLDWGNGFLSWQDPACVDDAKANKEAENLIREKIDAGEEIEPVYDPIVAYEDGGDFTPQKNTDPSTCKINTPGSVIKDTINKTIGTSLDELVAADEISEVVGAVVQGLVINIMGGGGLAGSGGGGGANNSGYQAQLAAEDQKFFAENKSRALSDIQDRITVENNYSQVKNQSIGRVDTSASLVQSLISCYSGSASSTIPTSPFTQSDITAASSTINSINAYKTSIQRDIAVSEVNIRNLQKVSDAVTNLSYEQRGQLTNILSQFTSLLGQVHNEGEVIQAQYDRDYGLSNTLNDVDTATNQRIDSCRERRGVPVRQSSDS